MILNKHWPLLVIGLLCIPLFFLGIRNTHDWGDDFSQYIQQARSIAEGKPYYYSTWIFNPHDAVFGPPQYPPGFPLLLAPLVKLRGLDLRAMFYFNSVIFSLLYFVLYKWFRYRTHAIAAICLSTICIYCGYSVGAKQMVLSDVPCWLFVSTYFVLRDEPARKWWRQVLLGATLLMAILIRTQAVFLIGAEMLYLFVAVLRDRRRFRALVLGSIPARIAVVVLVLFLVLNATLLKAPSSTLSFYIYDFVYHKESYWTIIGHNVNYLLTLFPEALYFRTVDPFWQSIVTIAQTAFLAFGIAGFLKTLRSGLSVADYYFLFMCLLIIIFPQHQGVRYIVSAIPVFLWYCYVAMRTLLAQVFPIKSSLLCILLTLMYLSVGYDDFKRSSIPAEGNIPGPHENEAFAYIREHVSDTDVIAFSKPRALALYTRKRCTHIAPDADIAVNAAYLNSLHTRYILFLGDNSYYRSLFSYFPPKDSANIGGRYRLFTLW